MFNPLRLINDLRYFEGDWALHIVSVSNRRSVNVEYVQKLFPESYSDFTLRNLMYDGALQNIENGEELILDYASSNYFESAPRARAV